MPNQWYIYSSLGIDSICPVINCLAEVAGLPKGNYRNQSGRSSTCTHMFANRQDEQVICHVSGHRSRTIRTYKHVSNDICRSPSESIQGPIVRLDSVTQNQCKSNGNGVTATISKPPDNESDIDEFVPNAKEIQTPLKCKFVLKESVSEVGNICDMITKVASQKKYKKIHLNIKFSDN